MCKKLHIGKTCYQALCRDLFVGGWKVEVQTDIITGNVSEREYFSGMEKMESTKEQMYLGDIISADGKHLKNIQNRKNKALGNINQIMQILESNFFGKYFFKVDMILRSSLLLSSLLLNSEAWVNITDQDVRRLEQSDEMLLSRILDADANTSNPFKYLELGIYPIRFEIIKRKLIFLQYMLKQEKTSMIYEVFQTTCDSPTKNDFVKTCEAYLNKLEIKQTFSEIEKMSKWEFKKLVKENTHIAAFKYLVREKNKQTKIMHIQYQDLEMQSYLMDGNKDVKTAKFIFKARVQSLDIKCQEKWKYSDNICIGCNIREETGEEILNCSFLGEDKFEKPLYYDMFYQKSVSDMILVAKAMMMKLKIRKEIIENG